VTLDASLDLGRAASAAIATARLEVRPDRASASASASPALRSAEQHQLPPWHNPGMAPDGRRIQDNFFRWFDKSALVDKSGWPLVVAHTMVMNADARDRIQVTRGGAYGPGIYSTIAPDCKGRMAPGPDRVTDGVRTIHLVGRVVNPFQWRTSESAYDAMIDGELLDDVLGRELADKVIARMGRKAMRGDFGLNAYGDELQIELRRRGHDGLLIMPPWIDGPREPGNVVVVWDPAQLKPIYGNSGLFRESWSLTDPLIFSAEGCPSQSDHLETLIMTIEA